MTARPQDVALLPCPCGKPARMSAHDSAGRRSAHCDDEDCFWMVTAFTDEQVTERWNRRSAALASAQAREEELRAEVAQLDEANRQLHAHGTQMYAELEELRPKCDGLTAEVEHHTAYAITHRGALRYCNSSMRDAYSDEKVRADAAEARAERLEEALRYALNQNEHDMVLTGDEIRDARAALSTNAATQTGETT